MDAKKKRGLVTEHYQSTFKINFTNGKWLVLGRDRWS